MCDALLFTNALPPEPPHTISAARIALRVVPAPAIALVWTCFVLVRRPKTQAKAISAWFRIGSACVYFASVAASGFLVWRTFRIVGCDGASSRLTDWEAPAVATSVCALVLLFVFACRHRCLMHVSIGALLLAAGSVAALDAFGYLMFPAASLRFLAPLLALQLFTCLEVVALFSLAGPAPLHKTVRERNDRLFRFSAD